MRTDVTEDLLEWVRSHYFGKYRGTVTDNTDPTQRGRLKVRVPAVLADVEVWAMPCVPYAGASVGFYAMPDSGTGVWVEFEGGDPSYAIWSGCFWGDGELPDSGGPDVKIWKTTGLTLRLDDQSNELLAESTQGASVTLAADAKTAVSSISHTVSSSGVVSDAGTGKIEVTQSSVSVNSGALEVM